MKTLRRFALLSAGFALLACNASDAATDEPPPASSGGTGAGGTRALAGTGGAMPAAGSQNLAPASGGAGGFQASCSALATSACERCLCTACSAAVQHCNDTPGCNAILACVRDSQCKGADCYCGTYDPVLCAMGQGNGPCKSVILGAPGARTPTLLEPSAGPASDAALAISDCTQPGHPCASDCPM